MQEGNNFVIVNDGTSKFFKCLKCPYKSGEGSEFLEHVVKCKATPKKLVVTETIELPDSPPPEANNAKSTELDCVLCPKKFTRREELEDHLKSHWAYKCRVCDGSFKTQLAQRTHEFRYHDPDYDPHSMACKNCTQKFQRSWDLFQHLVNVHFPNGFLQCKSCPKLFKTANLLEDHCRDCHSNDTAAPTKIMENEAVTNDKKILKSSSSVAEIVRNNEETNLQAEKIYPAVKEVKGIINSTFSHSKSVGNSSNNFSSNCESEDTFNADNLLVPIATSDAGKVYYCRDCPQVFDKRRGYKEHIRAHRPYKCKICKKKFKTEHFLHIHGFSEHHPDYDRNSTQCKSCLEKFEDSTQLFFHLVTDHDLVKLKYACHLCKKSFEFEKNYEFHVVRVHKHSGSKNRKCYSNTNK